MIFHTITTATKILKDMSIVQLLPRGAGRGGREAGLGPEGPGAGPGGRPGD